jgi:tRNA A-37 threonylcarbamoyl transferase component Bud32
VSYQTVGVLGRGGTAVVELAIDHHGRQVATKRIALTGSAAQMRVARQRLRREAQILRDLAHPGIVPIVDVIDDGSEVVLVFPAWYENLEDRVERLGPLRAEEVTRIGRVLLTALAAAHRHGVVHRDIKPANVLFDYAGEPALSDFGVAVSRQVTAGLTPSGWVVGTPMWMAPEQARGEPAGPASDVFSLAATLRFAATGEGPYAPGPAQVVIGRAAQNQIRSLPAALPQGLRAPLGRMLDPRPERRPSASAILGGRDGTRVTAVRQSRRPSLGRWARRILTGEPVPPVAPTRRRRLTITVTVVAVISLIAAIAAVAGLVAAGPTTRTAVRAPHTNGKTCDAGWYDLDGNTANGCESHSDFVLGTVLTADVPVRANLVPASTIASFTTHVSGDSLNFCWGALHVTLTAPAQAAEQLTVWRGTKKVASALSADGSSATATVDKPSCFGSDSEDLIVTVTAVAATGAASAADFTLTRDGGW